MKRRGEKNIHWLVDANCKWCYTLEQQQKVMLSCGNQLKTLNDARIALGRTPQECGFSKAWRLATPNRMAHMCPSERSHANRKWGNFCCIEETNHIAMQRRWDKCKLLLESWSLSWVQRSARPACSTYLRELLLYEPTACALVGIYKLCPFCFGVSRKLDMHMVIVNHRLFLLTLVILQRKKMCKEAQFRGCRIKTISQTYEYPLDEAQKLW